jgi:hypothetical protein
MAAPITAMCTVRGTSSPAATLATPAALSAPRLQAACRRCMTDRPDRCS